MFRRSQRLSRKLEGLSRSRTGRQEGTLLDRWIPGALLMVNLVSYFFFFQAEDGIRDWSVTGVQTCALPICERDARADPQRFRVHRAHTRVGAVADVDEAVSNGCRARPNAAHYSVLFDVRRGDRKSVV